MFWLIMLLILAGGTAALGYATQPSTREIRQRHSDREMKLLSMKLARHADEKKRKQKDPTDSDHGSSSVSQ